MQWGILVYRWAGDVNSGSARILIYRSRTDHTSAERRAVISA